MTTERTRSSAALPAGWSVELLGMIEAVKFTHRDGYGLLWCDGRWQSHASNGRAMPAPAVPAAQTMTEARRVGAAWIREMDA